jgi:hypothetical protein
MGRQARDIQPAAPSDLPIVRALFSDARFPVEDLDEAAQVAFLIARSQGQWLMRSETSQKKQRPRDDARADVFDYMERFYNPAARCSIGNSRHRAIEGAVSLEFPDQIHPDTARPDGDDCVVRCA